MSQILNNNVFLALKIVFNITNSDVFDKMPHATAFHLVLHQTRPHSIVDNVSDCRYRARPCPILLWRLIMKQFLRLFSSLPLIQEGMFSVTSESMCTKVLVNRLVKLAQKKV